MMGRRNPVTAGLRWHASGLPAVLAACLFGLVLGGCAGWQQPAEFDDSTLRTRVQSQQVRGVTLSAAVLSSAESERIFGVKVNQSGVQPVWIEVVNDTDQVLWMLRSGTDPDLFSPLEVAWSFHTSFAGDSNASLDQHFDELGFDNPVPPGAARSGIIYTNPHDLTRLLNVDILGQGEVFAFTLLLAVPDHRSDESRATLADLQARLQAAVPDSGDLDEFRQRLRQLPCCASNDDGSEAGDPLNVILVGEFADIVSAFVRRGFRLDLRDFHYAQRLFGRAPDLAARKAGQGGVPATWIRVWLAPFSFDGQPVFVAQTARQQGWRSVTKADGDVLPSPEVDEVRNILVQDMTYSGGLQKIAFDRGVGATAPGEFRDSLGGARYRTDGLRAVMFFITRPLSLADIEIIDWLPLHRLRESGAGAEIADDGN
jgi:hypothetical protein